MGNALLGEPTLAHDFATTGNLLVDDCGTSMAAPKVAHLAARVLGRYPGASINLVRALLVAHARIPDGTAALDLTPNERCRLVGYGMPNGDRTLYSLDGCVSLVAEEAIEENQHHFFEIPLPADFLEPWRRDRAVTVALAHMPLVRTTRVDYRGSKLAFRLVRAGGLEEVVKVFRKTPKAQREELLKEVAHATVGATARDRGTLQAATYWFPQIDDRSRHKGLFVVVTRTVPRWAEGRVENERYALVVVIEDRSEVNVRYYRQIVALQQRQRARQR